MELKTVISGMASASEAQAWLLEEVAGPPQHVAVSSVKSWALKQPALLFGLKQKSKGLDQAAILADTILEAIGINMPPWDMEDPANIGMMDAAVGLNLLSADQKTALIALSETKIPRWQSLGLRQIPKGSQIAEAL